MTPESANGTPNSVASRGTAFSRKNMTTKVGAARISPMTDAGDAAEDAAAETSQGQQQAERQPDGDRDGGDLEIDRHAGQKRRQEARRQPVDQRRHDGTWRRSSSRRSRPHSQTTIITTAV